MKILPVLVPAFLCAALTSGCAVTQQVYLQDATVKGATAEPPLFVTTDTEGGQFTVSGRVTVSRSSMRDVRIAGHSPVNAHGVYELDTVVNGNRLSFSEKPGANVYTYAGKNLHWDLAGTSFALDAQYAVTGHFALVFGGNYTVQGSSGFWGGTLGLALLSGGAGAAVRIDAGLQLRSSSYVAQTAVVTRTTTVFGQGTETVGLFRDRGRTTSGDMYGAITVNTRNPDWPVHLFFNAAVTREHILRHTPVETAVVFPLLMTVDIHDARAEYAATLLCVTPGLAVALGPRQHLLLGARYQASIAEEENEESLLSRWSPFLQVQFTL